MAQCHHVIPLSMGVPGMIDNLDNLSMVCTHCHKRIHNNPIMYAEMIKVKLGEGTDDLPQTRQARELYEDLRIKD
jgi:hypothetical protein